MLINIGEDMVVTWGLCGGLCGTHVNLMSGRMLINIKSKMKPRFFFKL